jgi:hypothetical protein
MREDLYHGYWRSLGHKTPRSSLSAYSTWAVVPGLEIFLRKFGQLSALEVVVSIEDRDPPDFEGLLPIYDLCGKKTNVEFISPNAYGTWDARVSFWSFAWEQCLRENGRI